MSDQKTSTVVVVPSVSQWLQNAERMRAKEPDITVDEEGVTRFYKWCTIAEVRARYHLQADTMIANAPHVNGTYHILWELAPHKIRSLPLSL